MWKQSKFSSIASKKWPLTISVESSQEDKARFWPFSSPSLFSMYIFDKSSFGDGLNDGQSSCSIAGYFVKRSAVIWLGFGSAQWSTYPQPLIKANNWKRLYMRIRIDWSVGLGFSEGLNISEKEEHRRILVIAAGYVGKRWKAPPLPPTSSAAATTAGCFTYKVIVCHFVEHFQVDVMYCSPLQYVCGLFLFFVFFFVRSLRSRTAVWGLVSVHPECVYVSVYQDVFRTIVVHLGDLGFNLC